MQMRWLTRVGLSESTFFIPYPMARIYEYLTVILVKKLIEKIYLILVKFILQSHWYKEDSCGLVTPDNALLTSMQRWDVVSTLVWRGVATTHVGYYAALVKRLKHSQSSSSCHNYVFMTIVGLLDLFHKHLRLNYIIWLVKRNNGTSFAMIAKSYRYNEGGTRRPLCVGNACWLDLAQPPSKHQIISQILSLRNYFSMIVI